jgi:hypothetical protein
MASPKVPDCSDVPRRYQKSFTPMAISTCSPPSVKSAADSGQQAEAFALVDHLHWYVALGAVGTAIVDGGVCESTDSAVRANVESGSDGGEKVGGSDSGRRTVIMRP